MRYVVALALLLPFSSGAASAQTPGRALYQNPALPVERRVDDLVSRMTLEEKVTQMTNTSAAIPRLNVPAYDWWNEGLHGVARSGYATMFPQAIGMAATWNAPLLGEIAETISTEARAKYQRGGPPQYSLHLLRPEHLVAEHQHLSRSALGTRAGDLRRRPLPDRAARRFVRRWPAGDQPRTTTR